MARFNRSALVALGLWQSYEFAFQLRGIVYSAAADTTALVKGMGRYDPDLLRGIAFPTETRKAHSPGRPCDVSLSLDITKFTDSVIATPMLNGSFLAALKLGVHMLPAGELRDTAHLQLGALLEAARECTFEKMVKQAGGISFADSHQVAEACDTWDEGCTDAHDIDILPLHCAKPGVALDPTETMHLLEDKFESKPHCILHRRKENLLRGRSLFWARYKNLCEKPKLFFLVWPLL